VIAAAGTLSVVLVVSILIADKHVLAGAGRRATLAAEPPPVALRLTFRWRDAMILIRPGFHQRG